LHIPLAWDSQSLIHQISTRGGETLPIKPKRMKTIKAAYFGGNCQGGTIGYTIGKKDYEVTGEFYYNKSKDRIEHIHEGVRGGQYLIIW